jgi:excisionase family DNA binding protein
MQRKLFLSPGEIASELGISSTTVLRLIHTGALPAIRVSERIYRIPNATFEMYKSGSLRAPHVAPLGGRRPRPELGSSERLPSARSRLVGHAR